MIEYKPNHIPSSVRKWNTFLSVALLAYGTFGIYIDDLYLPGKRTRGVHLHGDAALIVYAAMLCAVLNLFAVIVDHYDKRDNEINYKLFAKVTHFLGWSLFIGGLIYDLFIFQKGIN